MHGPSKTPHVDFIKTFFICKWTLDESRRIPFSLTSYITYTNIDFSLKVLLQCDLNVDKENSGSKLKIPKDLTEVLFVRERSWDGENRRNVLYLRKNDFFRLIGTLEKIWVLEGNRNFNLWNGLSKQTCNFLTNKIDKKITGSHPKNLFDSSFFSWKKFLSQHASIVHAATKMRL